MSHGALVDVLWGSNKPPQIQQFGCWGTLSVLLIEEGLVNPSWEFVLLLLLLLLLFIGTGWSVEEAELAAQDRSIWKRLTSHAADAEMHDANR